MSVPVIIDTDPGVDDALALLFAAASPELDVLAVTTVGGNVGLDRATENACRVVPVAWPRDPPPVYRGAEGGEETAEGVHGVDGLGAVTLLKDRDGRPLYPVGAETAATPAAEAICALARRRPGEVVLVALGPLTNVAQAISLDPEAMGLLREIVVMGGAFREMGNVTPVAEFNIFVDARAAQAVCDARLPLRWVPLDVTHRCVLRLEQLDELPDTLPVLFARRITRHYMEHHAGGHGERGCYLHDPLAVGLVARPELGRTVPVRVDVETEGRLTRGMTVADFRPGAHRSGSPPNAAVFLQVEAQAFLELFLERLGR